MLHKWPLESENHFRSIQILLIALTKQAQRIKDQPSPPLQTGGISFTVLLFQTKLLTPHKITSAKESFMFEQLF